MSTATSGAPLRIGNDVVDLAHPSCRGKESDSRFLERVFTPTEAERIASSSDPVRTLWCHWAAKEAAYKAVRKVRSRPPVLGHRDFRVKGKLAFPACPPGCGCRREARGEVAHLETTLGLRLRVSHGSVHALCWGPTSPSHGDDAPPPEVTWDQIELDDGELRRWEPAGEAAEQFSEAERASIRSPISAAARIHARRAAARLLDVAEGRLEVVREGPADDRGPPVLRLDGETAPWDLSLSHHGRWVAWALTPRGNPASGQGEGEGAA